MQRHMCLSSASVIVCSSSLRPTGFALQPIDQYRHAGHKARRAIAALEFPPGTFARLREQLFTEAASAPLWDPNLTWLPIAPLMLVKESSDLALKLSCVVADCP